MGLPSRYRQAHFSFCPPGRVDSGAPTPYAVTTHQVRNWLKLSKGKGDGFPWNAFALDHRIAGRLEGVHQEGPVPYTIRYAVGDNRVDMILADGAKSSLWWATKNEWLGLLDVAGLQVEALYGGFSGEPFTDDSGEYVFIARR
jgi:hypothetical protein